MNDFLKTKPSPMRALKALLRADCIVQWKQRRAMLMSLLVPIIFLLSFRSLIPIVGGASVLAICISVGLPAVGLLGYSASIARDRERGVFQRLRTAPVSTWTIMVSRILVQLAVMAGVTLITIIVAAFVDHIHVGFSSAILTIIAAIFGGASFLALAQVIVALVKGSDAVNAVVRLFYSAIAVVGSLGGIGLFGNAVESIVQWSPLGTTKTILAAALTSHVWIGNVIAAFFATIGYIVVLSAIGIKYFKWSTE